MDQKRKISLKSLPRKLFAQLLDEHSDAVLLESSEQQASYGRYTIMTAESVASVQIHSGKIKITSEAQKESVPSKDFFESLRSVMAECRPKDDEALSLEGSSYFSGGAIGFLSYDYAKYLWPRHQVAKTSDWPEGYFRIYPWALIYDHVTQDYWLEGDAVGWEKDLLRYDQKTSVLDSLHPLDFKSLQPKVSHQEYLAQIDKIQQWIRQGDVYQVNLSHPFCTEIVWDGGASRKKTAWQLYQNLMIHNPAPFSCFFPLDEERLILSSSPEMFLRLDQGQLITRPIKGTAPRGSNDFTDSRYKAQLWESEKDQAELMMIVDLERNDLGKVCEYGSVQVSELKTLESYSSVHHLVSTIKGDLRKEYDVFDALQAMFPCGSITGTPKLRAMERIDQLESSPRGVYTGSIGWVDFSGNAMFNVAIRTLVLQQQMLTFNVGGGIVMDSVAQKEYEETLHKGRAMVKALGQKF